MIGCFKSLREAIRTRAANFVESQSELMKASEKPSCTVRTQRSDQDSSRPLLARGKTAISRFYRASVPVGPGRRPVGGLSVHTGPVPSQSRQHNRQSQWVAGGSGSGRSRRGE